MTNGELFGSIAPIATAEQLGSPPTVAAGWTAPSTTNSAQTFTAVSFDPVHIANPTSSKYGNGARFRLLNECVTITAYHVVSDTVHPRITPIGSGEGRATVQRSDEKVDVALIRQAHRAIEECPILPSAKRIRASIRGASLRELWIREEGSGIATHAVTLDRTTSEVLQIRFAPSASTSTFQPGMSGSLLVFDGVPVAILKEAGGRSAIATRLDYVISLYADDLPKPIPSTKGKQTVKPYDETQLPSFYKNIVLQARQTKQRVLGVVKNAERVKIRAEDEAALARQLPKKTVRNGRAHFNADESLDYYAGEVWKVGNNFGSQGFGVSESTTGEFAGDIRYCRWVRGQGCSGVGFYQFAENLANKSRKDVWRGGFKDGRYGLGHLRWKRQDGDVEVAEAWYYHDKTKGRPGVWQHRDGRLFEGIISTTWDGWGVLWNKDGQVRVIGRWENGSLPEDQTEAWRSGALK